VQPEDEPWIARAEGAGELGAVADLAGAGQQPPADLQLPPLPHGQRRGNVPARGHQFLGQGPAVVRRLGGAGRRAYLEAKKIEQPDQEWEGQDRLNEVTNKLGELMEQYRTGLSGSIVFPMVRKLEEEQRLLIAEQARFTGRQHRKATTMTGEWDDMDLYAQRAVIQSVIEAVVIKPSGARRGQYDPSRVDVIPLQ
jgi:hypothetical protein